LLALVVAVPIDRLASQSREDFLWSLELSSDSRGIWAFYQGGAKTCVESALVHEIEVAQGFGGIDDLAGGHSEAQALSLLAAPTGEVDVGMHHLSHSAADKRVSAFKYFPSA
jgi:hypothetical protein